jgi:succinyl-diaminopimelate desuccinylase
MSKASSTTTGSSATDPVSLAQSLIRCESVTPNEGGALTFLQRVLEGAGFDCHRVIFSEPGTPDVDNLYARLGTKAPNLCFAGHTDVVPPGDSAAWTSPPFAAEIKDGVLYGRGAVDMKGEIACFIAAAVRYLAGAKIGTKAGAKSLPGSLSLLITGDEEGPSINGTVKLLSWLKQRGDKLDACVVGEPSSLKAVGDEIKIGRRGCLNGEIIVKGHQGHAAYPHIADNPIPKLARLIERLAALKLDDGTEHFEPSHLAVTIISVPNTATNVIPGRAKASFNVRYNDAHTRADIERRISDCCQAAAAEIGANYELKFTHTGDVFLTEPGPLLETMVGAVRAVTGHSPRLSTGGGTSDARFVKDYCPVVELGLTNATIHQVDERVPLADLETLTRIYERFIADFFAAK